MIYDLKTKKETNQGFTLLELLVVIAIMAILIALGTVSYSMAQKKSRDSKVKSDLKEIQNSLESYFAINGDYPSSYPSDLDSYFASGDTPTDPKTGSDYAYTVATPGYDNYCLCSNALETSTADNPTGNADTQGASGACSFTAGNYFCVTSLQ